MISDSAEAPTDASLAIASRQTQRRRLQLVCWQLNMKASRVRPAWDVALRTQLLEPVGIEPGTGERCTDSATAVVAHSGF